MREETGTGIGEIELTNRLDKYSRRNKTRRVNSDRGQFVTWQIE
jgi:hypothetical protein